jgi:hypothetical protein
MSLGVGGPASLKRDKLNCRTVLGSTSNTRSCTRSLGLIPQPDKPDKMPSFQHMYEGVLPWYRICSSTSSH